MPDRVAQRLSYRVLCASLVVVLVVFGVYAKYTPGVHHTLAVLLLTVMGIAAWKLGAGAIRAEEEARRNLAAAGSLLILPIALFSLLAGFGTPWQANAPQNQLRYLVLLVDAIALAGGLIVLREALREAGEHFYSTLGFVAALLASPLYLVWAAILHEAFAAKYISRSGHRAPYIVTLADMSDLLLFFGVALTYLATAAFAMSLGRTGWIGRKAARAFMASSFLALLCLVIRGVAYPSPTVFEHWYTIVGFVAGIPGVPFIMPYLFGVVLLNRAGNK